MGSPRNWFRNWLPMGCQNRSFPPTPKLSQHNVKNYWISEIGEDCTETSDCRADRNLECREEKCECLENHVEDEKTCLKKAENIGDPCTVDGQCTSISAICKENKCEALTTIPAPSPPTIGKKIIASYKNFLDFYEKNRFLFLRRKFLFRIDELHWWEHDMRRK